MSGQGTTTLNFGTFPGSTDASVAVSAPTIGSSNLVEAWIFPTATTDHTADEHWADPPEVYAGNITAGVGFTIYGVVKKRADVGPMTDSTRIRNVDAPMVYGLWTVAWVWN